MDFIFKSLYNMIFGGAAKVITDAAACSVDIFNQDIVKSILDFFRFLGGIVLAVGIVFAIANFAISRVEGNYVPIDKFFMNIFYSVVALFFMQDGAIFVFNLADTISAQIKDVVKMQKADEIVKLLCNVLTYSIVWEIVLFTVWVIMLLIVYFQAAKRSGMYVIQILVGYMYIFNIPSGNTEGIFDWCRQTAALAITNVLQISMLIVSLRFLSSGKFMPSLVILFAATSVEKVAARYGMSAGSRQSIGTGIRSVGNTVNLVSSVKKAFV